MGRMIQITALLRHVGDEESHGEKPEGPLVVPIEPRSRQDGNSRPEPRRNDIVVVVGHARLPISEVEKASPIDDTRGG